ncbi:MAG: hypothetical protein Q9176_004929 [Flavoplaca citrina]
MTQTIHNICAALEESLSSLTTIGSFATAGKVPGDVSTGLSIDGIGRIAFPLIEHQAKQIVDVCHQAPFGKGSETVIDESVRKTWELNPNQFNLVNPTWNSTVTELVDTVSIELGCDPDVSVEAHLHKLLLYVDGAHFQPHQDTEEKMACLRHFLFVCRRSMKAVVLLHYIGKGKVFDIGSSFHHTYVSW